MEEGCEKVVKNIVRISVTLDKTVKHGDNFKVQFINTRGDESTLVVPSPNFSTDAFIEQGDTIQQTAIKLLKRFEITKGIKSINLWSL